MRKKYRFVYKVEYKGQEHYYFNAKEIDLLIEIIKHFRLTIYDNKTGEVRKVEL